MKNNPNLKESNKLETLREESIPQVIQDPVIIELKTDVIQFDFSGMASNNCDQRGGE